MIYWVGKLCIKFSLYIYLTITVYYCIIALRLIANILEIKYMNTQTLGMVNKLSLIYDGECFFCSNTARAIKIRQAIGMIELINARDSHPLVAEAIKLGYDLNEGILVQFKNQYYYGRDALHFLALVGSQSDTFNKMNSMIFQHKFLTIICYPVFKGLRNIMLFIRKTPPIATTNTSSLIEKIYGEDAHTIPIVLKKRYASTPYVNGKIILTGTMNVTLSKLFNFLSPILQFTGTLVPYSATNIPVTVNLISDERSDAIMMERHFYYQGKKPYIFSSCVMHIKNNLVIEEIKFGIVSKLIYSYKDNTIFMNHGGYALKLGSKLITLPLGIVFGRVTAYEKAISDIEFEMQVNLTHPLFGRIFQYDGTFKICNNDAS